jgi:hypothetical protein
VQHKSAPQLATLVKASVASSQKHSLPPNPREIMRKTHYVERSGEQEGRRRRIDLEQRH